MSKSYFHVTPTDFETLALVREVPFVDVDIVRNLFYKDHELPDYGRKKLTMLEKDGLLKGWMIPGQKKLYTLTRSGGRFLNYVSPDIEGRYFKPDLKQKFIFTPSIYPPAINHTRQLIQLFLSLKSFNFFDSIFIFDHIQGKDTYTKNRPDILLSKGDHTIYLEYENSQKAPKSYYDRFQNFFKDTPHLVLILYVCSENWLTDRIQRYITEFRTGDKALKFKEGEIKESERLYIGTPSMTFRNCLDKTLTIQQVIAKLGG